MKIILDDFEDFEDFFEEIIVKCITEIQLFMPTTKIVQKSFFNYC